MQKRMLSTTSGLVLTLALAGCAGSPPDSEFEACPSSPNCVSSLASDEEHIIGSFRLGSSPVEANNAWQCLTGQAEQLPGEPRKVVNREDYVRIEYTSATLRFVDDLELKKESDTAQVRSASRLGYRDFGVNRKRVTALHVIFKEKCHQP